MAIGGLALGSLSMVGGTAIGGDLGPLAVGYGLLVALTALYLFAGLAIRERIWRRLSRPMPTTTQPDRLAVRGVINLDEARLCRRPNNQMKEAAAAAPTSGARYRP
jgi:hypothetical protein